MIKCTAVRLKDAQDCQWPAKYEAVMEGRHVAYVCGTHARQWTKKALHPLHQTKGNQIREDKT
jgi:hypothetical protein